jgi:seryl-tRNA synthetase
MLDIKHLRSHPTDVAAALARRHPSLSIDDLLALDAKRLVLLKEEETLRNQRNQLSKQVGELKRQGHHAEAEALLAQGKALGDALAALATQQQGIDEAQQQLLLTTPNLPSPTTPDGQGEADNPECRRWGDAIKARIIPNLLPHYELGAQTGWLDVERGVKLAQSRFTVLRGLGARLSRALIQLMLDVHTQEHGYEEIAPPLLVNQASMMGTGQLPKFADDMFKLADDALYLIPTAEVPVTNLYRDELLSAEQLPMAFTAYTPCFRREAGSAGRDTRGLIRQHQFDKVELVHLTTAEQGEATLEALVRHAETILQRLELPYRVVELCAADLGFSATRCYDIEVWLPSQATYREISSCSLMGTFQARRMNLRYRDPQTGKPTYATTLNGSGLAVGRTLAALLECAQTSEGGLRIPVALRPYLGMTTTELISLEPTHHAPIVHDHT